MRKQTTLNDCREHKFLECSFASMIKMMPVYYCGNKAYRVFQVKTL